MSYAYHYSEKSWKYEHSFILRELYYNTDIVSTDKHSDTHDDKHETPELCQK